jgi:endonuclease/exonuclease/phosphatase family metal-dependent hydrolase
LLKVLTLNIWNNSGPYDARKVRIREWIERLDPDVIGFQEVLREGDYLQAAELTDGYSCVFAQAQEFWRGPQQFGNAIASRWPIKHTEIVALPDLDTNEDRCAISANIEAPFGDLSFTCTHLNWKFHHGFVREKQVVPLFDLATRRRPKEQFPPIVVGDFNADPDSAEIRYASGLQTLEGKSVYYHDAWAVAGAGGPGFTWSNRNDFAAIALEPNRRIDYIFVGYPIRRRDGYGIGKVETCRVVCDDEVDGAWPSDHFGLYAELRTEPLEAPRWAMT